MKRTTIMLLFAVMILLLALSACVRPAPEELTPASPTPGLIVNPTLPIATLPPGGVVDPGVGAASPTPLPILPSPVPATPTPLPPPPDPTAAPQPGGETVHVVQAGENLYRIGLRYGCTAEQLAAHNGIANINVIYVGQEIRIPACQ